MHQKHHYPKVMSNGISISGDIYDFDLPIVMYSHVSKRLFLVSYRDLFEYSITENSPIGIVVIPEGYGNYGSNRIGVMALRFGDPNNLSEGSSTAVECPSSDLGVIINYWKHYNELPLLVYKDGINYSYQEIIDKTYKVASQAYLSKDLLWNSNTGNGDLLNRVNQCYHDATCYYIGNTYFDNTILSPYKGPLLGEQPIPSLIPNPDYSSTDNPKNVLSQFTGRECTKRIVNAIRDANNLPNNNVVGSDVKQKATLACAYYSPIGTAVGDWFLPSIGELLYIYARLSPIRADLSSLQSWNPDLSIIDIKELMNRLLHTSTATFDGYHFIANSIDVRNTMNSNSYAVLPFMTCELV